MGDTYDDGSIICGPDWLEIRHYYFPIGAKIIPYAHVKGVQRVQINGVLSGKWRLWGTANPRYWANLDVTRPKKSVGFVIDLGHLVCPIVTPSRPDEFEAVLRERANLGSASSTKRGPFI